MIILTGSSSVIDITGSADEVVTAYLRIFLSNKRLTDKQLKVTSALVSRYSEYTYNGVSEPYASQLLFSTETRKSVYSELGMGSAHLNNTFNSLCDKGILVKDSNKYVINPHIVPKQSLTFKFNIHDKPRSTRGGGSHEAKPTKVSSKQNNREPVRTG